jgi:hypothetical protein
LSATFSRPFYILRSLVSQPLRYHTPKVLRPIETTDFRYRIWLSVGIDSQIAIEHIYILSDEISAWIWTKDGRR